MAFCKAVLFPKKRISFLVRTLEFSVLITGVLFVLKICRAFTMMQTSTALLAISQFVSLVFVSGLCNFM